jgi:hypothetical protein
MDLQKNRMLTINKALFDICGKKKTLTMEIHLFMLAIVVSSLTRPIFVSRANELTFTCHSGSLEWFASMYGRQA